MLAFQCHEVTHAGVHCASQNNGVLCMADEPLQLPRALDRGWLDQLCLLYTSDAADE